MSDQTAQEAAEEKAMSVLGGNSKDWRDDWDPETFRSLEVEKQWEMCRSPGRKGEYVHPGGGYTICAAKVKSQNHGPCLQRSGMGTDHVGRGRCKYHDGGQSTKIMHGRYSKITREPTGDLIDEFKSDEAPLDVQDELAVMRSLVVEYINDYHELKEDLHAWNDAEMREHGEAARPEKIPRVDRALEMLEKVASTAQKQQKLEQDDAISRRQLVRVMTHMGRVVDDVVMDDTLSDEEKVAKIRDEWRNIYI